MSGVRSGPLWANSTEVQRKSGCLMVKIMNIFSITYYEVIKSSSSVFKFNNYCKHTSV